MPRNIGRRAVRFALVMVLALAAALPLSLAAPAEPASAASWLQRSDYLRFPAPSAYLRVKNRRIFLTGCYTWRAFSKLWSADVPNYGQRGICLRPGNYRWHIRMFEYSRKPCMQCPLDRTYMIESRLYELATGNRPWVVKHHLRGGRDGTYAWGSTLQHR